MWKEVWSREFNDALSGEYCSKVESKFSECYREVNRRFSYVYMDTECLENCKEAKMILDFEPEEWWEILEHPSSLFVECEDEYCKVDGDLVVPLQSKFMVARLVRTIPECKYLATHSHPYSEHIHVQCNVELDRLDSIVDTLSYIVRKAEEVIEE